MRNRFGGSLLLMIEHRRIEPAEFQRCVALLSRKIEDLAARAGVLEEERLDLEGILTALPPSSRGRASLILDGIDVQASEGSPAMAMAARYVRALARTCGIRLTSRPPRRTVGNAPGAPETQ